VKVYTRTGDNGSTALGNGARVSKAHPRIAACGSVDELNAVLGALRAEALPEQADPQLERVQKTLFEVGAFLADPTRDFVPGPEGLDGAGLERWLDAMASELPALHNFVLPGGGRSASLAHLARTVCRRAERHVVALGDAGENVGPVIPLLNRLSDALFVLARWLNARSGTADVTWRRAS
jgi:cob(I)alamin adenosyltransferase